MTAEWKKLVLAISIVIVLYIGPRREPSLRFVD
jgi:hypothetical protein